MSGDRAKNVICFVAMLVIFVMALIIDRAGVTPTTPSNPCKTSTSEASPSLMQNRIMKP